MSLSVKGRRAQSSGGKSFHASGSYEPLSAAIAVALSEEFGRDPSTLKTIAQLTRSNERAVRNWLDGKNGPSGENLVSLMRHSDLVLRTVLQLAGRGELGVTVSLQGVRQKMVQAIAAIDELKPTK
jgi:hypothetical protein